MSYFYAVSHNDEKGASQFYEGRTRQDFNEMICGELAFLSWPNEAFPHLKIEKLWAHISRHGSSRAHFTLEHQGQEIRFIGLTEEEYAKDAQVNEDA